MNLRIAHTWNGLPLPPARHARLRLATTPRALRVDVDAPFHGDPPPAAPPGPTDRLWEHEVVELFLLGADSRYLEIELGPHGHHLVIQLHGIRNVVASLLPIAFTTRIDSASRRWSGRASIPLTYLPEGLRAANAFAIHGAGEARRHEAAFPVPGATPDFHQPDTFVPCHLPAPRP